MAVAAVRPDARSVQTRLVALRLAARLTRVVREALAARAGVRRDALPVAAAVLADGDALVLLEPVAGAAHTLVRSDALAALAALGTHWDTGPDGVLLVAAVARARVRGRAVAAAARWIARRDAELAAPVELVAGVADASAAPALAVVAADGARRDAEVVEVLHVVRVADALARPHAHSVDALSRANWVTLFEDVLVSLVSLAAHLDSAHRRVRLVNNVQRLSNGSGVININFLISLTPFPRGTVPSPANSDAVLQHRNDLFRK